MGENGGMQAFEKCMEKRQNKLIPTAFLMKCLEEVLLGNIFEYADKYWRQVIGTAMGTRIAPSYAILFMHWLETTLLLGKWTGTQPYVWKRFIDDIFIVWTSTEAELKKFISHINSCHDLIKFTVEYDMDTNKIPFLDMEVSIDANGFIKTDLHG